MPRGTGNIPTERLRLDQHTERARIRNARNRIGIGPPPQDFGQGLTSLRHTHRRRREVEHTARAQPLVRYSASAHGEGLRFVYPRGHLQRLQKSIGKQVKRVKRKMNELWI